jgi:muconolactone D-isomerase
MLYIVTTKIHREAIPADQAAELAAKERAHAMQFVEQKKILSAYRKIGGSGSFFIVEAGSHEEVHAIFSSLPLAKYLEFDVTPVVMHPLFGGPA